jgi:hypothetical protein
VARKTLVRIKARAQSVVCALAHNLDFSEPRLPIEEECSLIRGKTRQRTARTGCASAHSWIYWR